MDTTEQVDRDLIDPDNEISGPLNIRRLQGNARCIQCKIADKDCYLERRAEGNHRCLGCSTTETVCQFRRLVVKEASASSFTWDQLLGDDPDVAAAASDAPTPQPRPRKRPYDNLVDEPSSYSQVAHASQWPQSVQIGLGNHESKVYPFPGLSRDAVEQELRRIFRPLTQDQIQVVLGLFERHPPLPNKDQCPIKAALPVVKTEVQNQSMASQPASQVRTNVSNPPLQNTEPLPSGFMHSEWHSSVEPLYVNNAGSWYNQTLDFNFDQDLLDPLYVPGVLSLADRQNTVFNNVNQALETFDRSSPYLNPTSFNTTPHSAHDANTSPVGLTRRSLGPRTTTSSVSDYHDVSLPFRCPQCAEVLNTRSETRKHMARHTKPFICNVSNCTRAVDGFATRNDLDRHIASVHDTTHAFKMYKCAVPGCKDPTKVWSRKDNFKAHLIRMHPEVNTTEYLERSTTEQDGAVKEG